MDKQISDFIRNVVLSDEVPTDMKEHGLNLLLNAEYSANNSIVNDFDKVRMNNSRIRFGLTAMQWTEVQSCIDTNRKIPAIKALREFAMKIMGDLLGLKEAKESVENDTYFRQPQY